jgi:hypothetical protein
MQNKLNYASKMLAGIGSTSNSTSNNTLNFNNPAPPSKITTVTVSDVISLNSPDVANLN